MCPGKKDTEKRKNWRYPTKTHYLEENDTSHEDSAPSVESFEFSKFTVDKDDANTKKQTNYRKKQFHRKPRSKERDLK